jgi:hypothetical protein
MSVRAFDEHARDGVRRGVALGIGTWATHRLLDTITGCALALAAQYLLWPRDRPEDETADAGVGAGDVM